ncbi:Z-ring formation inhibitor MciZ [Paenibacillus sp. OV219]|uniref:Z-ring formation inhibitor MciZ n=1 Tax=Paenibacillus sp. OV219 TaxID=1884377 RepID=UPI0008B8A7DC|nr:Z-ring formation inhibitor MciZ [Paenibacillus sp. OV219]SEN21907.1 Protein of unknown function [Paenibacillus sp. OV219]
MNQYTKQNQLTLVGKAWEIKHQLKLLAKASAKSGLTATQPSRTLRDYLLSAQ